MSYTNGSKPEHAMFSPSQPSWLHDTDEEFAARYSNKKAAELGTRYHEDAARMIQNRWRMSKSSDPVADNVRAYINDAIKYQMLPEVRLEGTQDFFGTADTIIFRRGLLRVHDLKTGTTKPHMDQLRLYAAYYCMQYGINPNDIQMDLRFYQNNEIVCYEPEFGVIADIISEVRHKDELKRRIDAGEY